MRAARQLGSLIVLGLVWGVLASCGGSETETAAGHETDTESTTTWTAPPTTITVPETTTTARSEWCLERDAGRWTQREPEEYDPSPQDAEKADIQRRLDRLLAQQIQEANTMFGNMLETYADNPALQAGIEDARQRAIRGIRSNYNNAVSHLDSRYARLHREGKAEHDARQRELAELAALELRNELQRYELECQ